MIRLNIYIILFRIIYMSQDMDDFVNEMDEDILDDEKLNDMIKDDIEIEQPKQPIRKQNVYQEQYRRVPQKKIKQNQEDFIEEQQMPMRMPMKQLQNRENNNQYSLDKLKNMVNINKIKLPLLVMIIFIILSLPQINNILGNYIAVLKPNEDNSPNYINLVAKGVLFGIIILVMSQLI